MSIARPPEDAHAEARQGAGRSPDVARPPEDAHAEARQGASPPERALRDDPPSAGERLWRRRSLALLAVLLPLTIAVTAYDSVRQWWTGRDLFAREAAGDAPAGFGGLRWQLTGLRMTPAPAGGRIPADAMAVVAQFSVQATGAQPARAPLECVVSLEDGEGRRWTPTLALPLPRASERECNAAIRAAAKEGGTQRVQHAFLVPREVAATLRPAISLASQRPYYLRFARRPELVQAQ